MKPQPDCENLTGDQLDQAADANKTWWEGSCDHGDGDSLASVTSTEKLSYRSDSSAVVAASAEAETGFDDKQQFLDDSHLFMDTYVMCKKDNELGYPVQHDSEADSKKKKKKKKRKSDISCQASYL